MKFRRHKREARGSHDEPIRPDEWWVMEVTDPADGSTWYKLMGPSGQARQISSSRYGLVGRARRLNRNRRLERLTEGRRIE